MYNLIIENGYVVDPSANFAGKKTIAIKNDRIVPYDETIAAKQKINADGCYVFPGFIDFHTHIYEGSAFAVKPELLFPYGITAVVDAGSTGAINFEDFYRNTIQKSMVKIKAYLNISSIGQLGGGIEESLDPALFDEAKITYLIDRYRDIILGIKIRCSEHLVEEHGMVPMQKTLELARKSNVPVCVHTTNPPVDAADLVSMLDKDDVYCHIFQGVGSTMIGKNNAVKPEFWEAKKRGVVFDAANGRMNFDYNVAIPALKENFFPDIISTDLTKLSFNTPGISPVKNLSFIMSKYLSLGMTVEAIVRAVTATPAKLMGMEKEIGTVQDGAVADLCICKIEDHAAEFIDSKGESRKGDKLFVPKATIANGEIVYCGKDL
ncbi:MAG: amidohydrolase [Firmicutes bacterium]|nr:amidohydrolase [Bacillota bacterium]